MALLRQKRSLIFSKKTMFIGLLLILTFASHFIFITQTPSLKKVPWLSFLYKPPFLKELQRMEGPLIEFGIDVRVLKVQSGNKIHLDFLSPQPDNSFLRINKILLKGEREAYHYHPLEKKQMFSLFIEDDDGDGQLDLIAPTFDKFFRRHKNIVTYNQQTKNFELKPSN